MIDCVKNLDRKKVEMTNALNLRFAQEELTYLLRVLDIPAIPGFDPELLKTLDEREQTLLMFVADRTLRARGIVHWESKEERSVDPLITGVLRDCASPRYNLFVDILEGEGLNSKCLYIFGEKAIIEHCEIDPGVQQLMVMPTVEDASERLKNLLEIQDKEANPLPAGQISQERLSSIYATVSSDVDGATSTLEAELPPETAHCLAIALHAPETVQHIALWSGNPDVERVHTLYAALTIVQGIEHLFLLWSEEPDISQVQVMSVASTDIWQYVERLLHPTWTKESAE